MTPNEKEPLPWESNFASSFKKHRENAGVSQAAAARLAAESGLSFHQPTIQRIEDGTRPVRLNEAMVLADILDISLQDMAGMAATQGPGLEAFRDYHKNAEDLLSLESRIHDNYLDAIQKVRDASLKSSAFHEWLLRRHTDATEQQAEALAKKHRIAKDSPEIQALLKDHPSPAMQAAADALNLGAHEWVQVEPSADDRASKKYFVGKDVLHPGSGEQKPNPNNSEVSSEWIDAEG